MAIKLNESFLPLLSKEFSYLNRYDIYMPFNHEKTTEVPTVYGKEPHAKDNREYPDYRSSDIRTINIVRGVGVETMALAEQYLHDNHRFSKLIGKQTCKGGNLFSFKVVGRDNGNAEAEDE